MNEDLKEKFKKIYDTNLWSSKESVSGTGSELNVTKYLREGLSKIIKKYNIKSIFDAPCGDFNWMKEIDMDGINYTGADIVTEIIENNKKNYPNTKFTICDITTDYIPKVDLIFTRDCLVHLSYDKITQFFHNIKKSGSKYLITTSFDKKTNRDIVDADWRPLNLKLTPFNMKNYIDFIDEKCTEHYPMYLDKVMLLYKIEDIKL